MSHTVIHKFCTAADNVVKSPLAAVTHPGISPIEPNGCDNGGELSKPSHCLDNTPSTTTCDTTPFPTIAVLRSHNSSSIVSTNVTIGIFIDGDKQLVGTVISPLLDVQGKTQFSRVCTRLVKSTTLPPNDFCISTYSQSLMPIAVAYSVSVIVVTC